MISVSAGADVYAPTLGYLIAMASAAIAVYIGNWIEKKMRVDDGVGAVAVHGAMGFLGMSGSASSPPATRPASTTSTARSAAS